MTTKHPRLQVTLDEQTSQALAVLAEKKELSLSAVAAQLIKQAIELQEDLYLSDVAKARDKKDTKWISHDDAWK